jgi:predicted DNA-binding protein with PD1-like motif
MEYKRYNDIIALRLDKDDEILSSLVTVAEKENIKAAHLNGIGATDNFTVGIFSLEKQTYEKITFNDGNYEITSLNGNITFVDDKPYIHAHITCANESADVKGGHLLEGIISLTCEIFITVCDGAIGRKHDSELNINKLNF